MDKSLQNQLMKVRIKKTRLHLLLLLGLTVVACTPRVLPPPVPPPLPPPPFGNVVTEEAISEKEFQARLLSEYKLKIKGEAFFLDSIYTPNLANPKISRSTKKLLQKIKNGCTTSLNCMPVFPIHYGFYQEERKAKLLFHAAVDYEEDTGKMILKVSNKQVYNRKIHIYSEDQKAFTAKVLKQEAIKTDYGCEHYYQTLELSKVTGSYQPDPELYEEAPLLGALYPLELEYTDSFLGFAKLKEVPAIYFDTGGEPSLSIIIQLNEKEWYTIWKFELRDDVCR